MTTLNIGNQDLSTSVLLILTLKSYVEKFQKGKQRSKIWDIPPSKGYKIAFCEDPFGNVIEIYTHSYERTILSL
jgi:hypothetical protein